MKRITFSLLLILLYSCEDRSTNSGAENSKANPATPNIDYVVINYFAHDTTLFTEGFLFHNGQLFESTGSPKELSQTKSVIGITDLATGKFDVKIEIDKSKYFGEGIVFFKNKLYQLTYKNQIGFIYDGKTFKKTGEFNYSNTEGWGMTTDGTSLIMSDGTNKLTYLDPEKLTPLKTLEITEQGYPIDKLNELEFIKGFLYANIWTTNLIVKIDPASGHVVGKMDMSSLANEAITKNPNADVLNGIAYDSTTDKVYITGKLWPTIYQIQFSH
nr:glutaminyl-peptide cyclotransferase [uncultured Lacibacter sp.]